MENEKRKKEIKNILKKDNFIVHTESKFIVNDWKFKVTRNGVNYGYFNFNEMINKLILKNKNNSIIKFLEFDLKTKIGTKDFLINVIKTGNFEGYSEALKTRRKRLKITKENIKKIKAEISFIKKF